MPEICTNCCRPKRHDAEPHCCRCRAKLGRKHDPRQVYETSDRKRQDAVEDASPEFGVWLWRRGLMIQQKTEAVQRELARREPRLPFAKEPA